MATPAAGAPDHAAGLRVLPPSPNWYCSQVCDWGWSAEHGALVAFGAKSDVFVYRVDAAARLAFVAQVARGRRAQRVTALRFLRDERVACGSEGGHVQVWDIETRELVEQHRKHAAEVTAVAAAPQISDAIVSGDRHGTIGCWSRDTGRVATFAPVSGDGVFSMAMAPRRGAALVAVGFRSGLLCLVDAAQAVVLSRVDAHEQELQGLAWRWTQTQGAWLASSSRDKSIKLWRVGGEAEHEDSSTAGAPALALDRVLRLPTGKQGQAYNPSKHLWLPVAWSSAGESEATMRLWSGSFDGNLLRWDVPVRKALSDSAGSSCSPLRPVAVRNGHSRVLFNIVALPSAMAAAAERPLPSLLTVSLDRELRLWTETRGASSGAGAGAGAGAGVVPAARTASQLLGLGGHVYCAAYNERSATLALACGDQTIRLWRLGGGKGGRELRYDTELLWKGLKSKVTSVAWHPLAAHSLAFGTEDGALGVYDTQAKKPKRLRSSHTGEVQQLEWRLGGAGADAERDGRADAFVDAMHELERAQADGARLEDALTTLEVSNRRAPAESSRVRVALWSRDATGKLLESDADDPDALAIAVSTSCSSFAWSEDESGDSILAIGAPGGSVKLADPALTGRIEPTSPQVPIETAIHDHSERVGAIAWRVHGNARLLATGGDDGKVLVYRLASGAPTLIARLDGHSSKITCLRWQPRTADDGSERSADPESDEALPLLASCAADGSVRVWAALDRARQLVARFDGHVGRVLALDWVSRCVLVTGGEDQTARVWDLRNFPVLAGDAAPPLAAARAKKPARVLTGAIEDVNGTGKAAIGAANGSVAARSGTTKPKKKAKAKNAALFHAQTAPTPPDEVARLLAQRLQSPLRDETEGAEDAFMPALLQLGRDRIDVTGPRSVMAAFVSTEQTRFASEGDWEGKARLLLLTGRVADALRVVAEQDALDVTWLALAPMAGVDVWREMTSLFARQLEARGDHAQAALHWLSLGKVRAAARSLEAGAAFREALALLRLRLGPSDPLVGETTWRYAEWLESRGRFGDAALVFLSLEHEGGDLGGIQDTSWRWRAVRALVKTRSAACIAQAVELLHEAASEPAADALAFPATFVTVDMVGTLVREGRVSVAERAADLLLVSTPSIRVHSSLPMAETGFRLTRCLLGIFSAMERHRLGDDTAAAAAAATVEWRALSTWRREFPSNEAVQLLLALASRASDGSAYPMDLLSMQSESLTARADAFWSDVFGVCRLCGVWSTEGDADSTLEEAQELLMNDESSWLLLEWRATLTAAANASPSALRLDAAIGLLRLAVDASAHCLVSAMEHLVKLLTGVADSSSDDDQAADFALELVTLVFPTGVATAAPSSLMTIGELAEELADARSLWWRSRLLQCRVLIARAARGSVAADTGTWAVASARAVLDAAAAEDSRALDEALEGELGALENLLLELRQER